MMLSSCLCLFLLAPLKPVDAFFAPGQSKMTYSKFSENKVQAHGRLSITFTSPKKFITTRSLSALTGGGNGSSERKLDISAISKYTIAALTQMSIFACIFKVFDTAKVSLGLSPESIPFPAVALLFYMLSIKSRVFNPLNNQRPDLEKVKNEGASTGFRDRVMPSWTPPGIIFPIMWLLVIGPMRAYSSAVIFQEEGYLFFQPTILSFMFHLTCGDIFNTINNTERRYGTAVIGVLGALASAGFAATQYYAVNDFAGKLLGLTCVWLTIASALIIDTWRLNPKVDGDLDSLFPMVGDAETEFDWFSPPK